MATTLKLFTGASAGQTGNALGISPLMENPAGNFFKSACSLS